MSRDYCFTCFDTDEVKFNATKMNYLIYGKETCPKTGKKHLQGYVTFPRTYRIKGAQDVLDIGKAHMESKKGSRDQAREYCMKDGDYVEFGCFEPLTKEDLFKKPVSFLKVNYPEFYCRYHRGLEKLSVTNSPKWREVEVIWLWGEGGSGKTREALDSESVYKFDRPYEWFCGYENEERLVIDDVCHKDFTEKRGLFLNLLDGHPLRLPIKGGHTYAHWTSVYVTSNFDPEKVMIHPEWCRRINVVRRVTL